MLNISNPTCPIHLLKILKASGLPSGINNFMVQGFGDYPIVIFSK